MSTLVHVRWQDPEAEINQAWSVIEDLEPPPVLTTMGYLVRDEEYWIAIAHTVDQGEALGVIKIPRGCILTISEGEIEDASDSD